MAFLKNLGLLCVLACSMVGCEKGVDEKPKSESNIAKPYVAPDSGYIKNPLFVASDSSEMADWKLFQHASNTSYRVSVDESVLALTRVGVEPWGKISQRYRKKDIEPLLGKTLEFSVDVKGEFTEEYGESAEPSSIAVKIRGLRKGANAMMGSSNLFAENEPIVETLGLAPWRRYRIRFDVPKSQEARVTEIELSIVMRMGGTLWARGPSLVEVASEGANSTSKASSSLRE